MSRAHLRALLVGLLAITVLPSMAEARPWAWMGVRIRDLSEQETEEISKRHGIREGFGVVVVEVLEAPRRRAPGSRPATSWSRSTAAP